MLLGRRTARLDREIVNARFRVVFVKPDCDKVDFNIISHIPVLNGASQEDFLVIRV